MIKLLPLIFGFVSSTAIADPSSSSTQYVVREIGSSVYIEPSAKVGATGIAGAVLGTGIAASLQTEPIRLKENTDYACKYQNITTNAAKECAKKDR